MILAPGKRRLRVGPLHEIQFQCVGVERPVDGDGTATCDVGAFEFLPEPSVVEVPSASRVGLMVLATLLAGLGIIALGRRG